MQVPPQPLAPAAATTEPVADVQQQRDDELRNPANGAESGNKDFPLKFCTVCASNQNRFVLLLRVNWRDEKEKENPFATYVQYCCYPRVLHRIGMDGKILRGWPDPQIP